MGKYLEGFKEAMNNNGLKVDSDLITESGFQEEGGYKAMKRILEKPQNKWPRAVVGVNDPVAFGAIKAIREKELEIPNDIAIVGFSDDIRAKLLPVPLTTIQQPAYMVGKKATEKLIRLIEDEKEVHENIEIHAKLKVRASCGSKINSNII